MSTFSNCILSKWNICLNL